MLRSARQRSAKTAEAWTMALVCLVGCFSEPTGAGQGESSSSGESGATSTTSATSTSTTSPSTEATSTTDVATTQTTDVSVGTSSAGSSTTAECEEVSIDLEGETVPTDLILAIRAGASMGDNAEDLQNAFSAFSMGADEPPGDTHIVLVTEPPDDSEPGICFRPPMADPGCPMFDDSKPPHFLRLPGIGDADDPIAAIGLGLGGPIAAGVLREDGNKIFAVITDQDTTFGASDFAKVLQSAGPSFARARVFAASGAGSGCTATPNLDAIVDAFHGTTTPLCPLEMGAELIATLVQRRASCSFTLPAPPEGMAGESIAAQLAIDDEPLSISVFASQSECNGNPAGFIDNAEQPPRLRLCPATCADFQDNSIGLPTSLHLRFQCETD